MCWVSHSPHLTIRLLSLFLKCGMIECFNTNKNNIYLNLSTQWAPVSTTLAPMREAPHTNVSVSMSRAHIPGHSPN